MQRYILLQYLPNIWDILPINVTNGIVYCSLNAFSNTVTSVKIWE